ncbi:MAG TPA: hypothetical protein VLE74_01525 [Candidatus Saccharimonadales bacterium]|nr:hypothetical protein [Candidatus Saccharimonadales bacterium]
MSNQEAFEKIAEELAALGVVGSKMFGMPVWKLEGKALGGPWQDDMVFKLDGAVLEKALKLPGAKQFDPMGGRPMKQWVQLGPDHQDKWLHFAEAAAKGLLKETG